MALLMLFIYDCHTNLSWKHKLLTALSDQVEMLGFFQMEFYKN